VAYILILLLSMVMNVRPWANFHMDIHTQNRTEPGQVQVACTHDLRIRMQLRSMCSWTCYILKILFWYFRADSKLLGEVTRLRIIPSTWRCGCDSST